MNPGIGNLYRALIGLRTHHDRMLWSRVQTLIVVQGAVIAGSYAVGDHRLAGIFLLGGMLLSFVIYELVVKDQRDRDANDPIIERIGELLLPLDVVEELRGSLNRAPLMRMSATPPRWRPFLRGKYLIRMVVWAFIVFDVALGILHFLGKAPVNPTIG
ncbi:MAG: hypothetical protein IFK94_11455 [Acidobacteria bacterium]|uniref:Uncharacterized protein n=1 Tax=Candidatus Polarisedimenticola svalbardensis TaxID=2886004 RepID=A0A8J7C2Z0_9BACT|nr:hypothetical protein [Candidatus Polarisedimenticola svalbardensis]